MYLTHIEGESVIAEIFIRNLKNRTYKHMTAVSKTVYIGKLDDIVNEYNNTYHRTIKIRPIEDEDNTYIDSILTLKKLMVKVLNLKLVIMLEYQNIKTFFAKGYTPNWSEEYVINDLNDEEIIGTFYEK